MKRFALLCLLVFALPLTLHAQPVGWKLADVTPLAEVVEEEAEPVLSPLLSPDGSKLAWSRGDALCIQTFDSSETTCFPWPETFRGFGRYSNLGWSPDSAYLTFTPSFFDLFVDGDIWLLDAASGVYTNLTDDNFDGNLLDSDAGQANIDYLPTWNPANGDLYFFRSERPESGYTLALYLLPIQRREPKLVRDFTADFPRLSVYRPLAFSPDGARLALIVLGQQLDDTLNGIWVYDLKSGALDHLVWLPDLRTGLPDFITDNEQVTYFPETVVWTPDAAGLVISAIDPRFSTQGVTQMAYYVDVASGQTTALVDFTDVSEPSVSIDGKALLFGYLVQFEKE